MENITRVRISRHMTRSLLMSGGRYRVITFPFIIMRNMCPSITAEDLHVRIARSSLQDTDAFTRPCVACVKILCRDLRSHVIFC